ncbi:MAG: hypothetical protein JNK63_03455 [Chthonomonas sp.]|nr:hypothetical protein [Chthonomonas sp.]
MKFALLLAGLVGATPLVPEPIDRFIGISWSGIRIGATTDADIKRTFGTEKGAVRPEALNVKVVEGTPFRVDALLDGRGDKAKVTAIRLGYSQPVPLTEILKPFPDEAVTYYHEGRIEDWNLSVIETRGIGIFALQGQAKVALLLPPAKLEELTAGLSMAPTEVLEYDPKFTDDELLVEYGDVGVTLTSSKINFRSKREIENDIEDELTRRSRAKYLDYNRSGRATLSARIDVRYDDRRQTLTIDAQLSVYGENALGKVSASGSDSSRWTKIVEAPRIESSRAILDIVEEARTDLERNFDAAVRRQRPPTKEEIRNQTWAQIIDRATKSL